MFQETPLSLTKEIIFRTRISVLSREEHLVLGRIDRTEIINDELHIHVEGDEFDKFVRSNPLETEEFDVHIGSNLKSPLEIRSLSLYYRPDAKLERGDNG